MGKSTLQTLLGYPKIKEVSSICNRRADAYLCYELIKLAGDKFDDREIMDLIRRSGLKSAPGCFQKIIANMTISDFRNSERPNAIRTAEIALTNEQNANIATLDNMTDDVEKEIIENLQNPEPTVVSEVEVTREPPIETDYMAQYSNLTHLVNDMRCLVEENRKMVGCLDERVVECIQAELPKIMEVPTKELSKIGENNSKILDNLDRKFMRCVNNLDKTETNKALSTRITKTSQFEPPQAQIATDVRNTTTGVVEQETPVIPARRIIPGRFF